MQDSGTYTLLIELAEPAVIQFGEAGERNLEQGWYAYSWSAFGPSRVDRHRRHAEQDSEVRHWPIDYLLGDPGARVDDVVRTDGIDSGCEVATALREAYESVPDIGADDCECSSHLVYSSDRDDLVADVEQAHEAASE